VAAGRGGGAMTSPTPEELDDARKRLAGAAVSKMISSAIGEMVLLMSRDPAHKHYSFADIEWKILPPIMAGQYFIADEEEPKFRTRRATAMVTWACVSDELDARLRSEADGREARLKPIDWTSGEHVWLVDITGTRDGIETALTAIHNGALKGKTVNVPARGQDGKLKIVALDTLIAKNADVQAGSQPAKGRSNA
jgi:hemolysin-activating ACP:hemolysin acyltransferase